MKLDHPVHTLSRSGLLWYCILYSGQVHHSALYLGAVSSGIVHCSVYKYITVHFIWKRFIVVFYIVQWTSTSLYTLSGSRQQWYCTLFSVQVHHRTLYLGAVCCGIVHCTEHKYITVHFIWEFFSVHSDFVFHVNLISSHSTVEECHVSPV